MKRIFSNSLLSVFALFLLSSFSIRENPQDPPRGKKTERHIKMVKVDNAGNKTELDTVIQGDQVFVWQGDTVGGKDLKWISKDGFDMGDLHKNHEMNFEYKIDGDGEGNFFVMKSGKNGDHIIMPPMAPDVPKPPHASHVMMFRSNKSKIVIDLSDPGIISYDKKLLKNGTEKITIVRKQVDEDEEEEMIFNGPEGENMFWHGDAPGGKKTIKVIKSDDGSTQIFENDKLIKLKGEKGNATFVTDDGKVIKIRENKEGKEKQIEVEVEVEEKTEKENK